MVSNFSRAVLAAALALADVALAGGFSARQIFLPERHSRGDVNLFPQQAADDASWIWLEGVGAAKGDFTPFVRFRRTFTVKEEARALRFDVSADARFVLLLDGREIARGPHHGLPIHWYYQSCEIDGLEAGEHRMEAVVFSLGSKGPLCILSSGACGFMLKAYGDYDRHLTTGKSEWQAAEITNVNFTTPTDPQTMTGSQSFSRGTGYLDFSPSPDSWKKPCIVKPPVKGNEYGFPKPGWALFPTGREDTLRRTVFPGAFRSAHSRPEGWHLPGDEKNGFVGGMNALLAKGEKVVVPPDSKVRLLWDLGDYYCAYPLLETSGGSGAKVLWAWTEGLYDRQNVRSNRDTFAGKRVFRSMNDTFVADGRERAVFTTPWWRSGRWVELKIETSSSPLELRRLGIVETRSPMEPKARFECDDMTIGAVRGICVRGLQNCMHEMFMDCPYFEQQMYPGDTRVQMLILNSINGDDRMIRYGMEIFDYGRRDNGLVPMNFPSRNIQDSSTYSMCWAMMFADYVRWHGTNGWLKARMPGLRHTLHLLSAYENGEGLVENLPGWNFMDWVPGWDKYGNAPGGRKGLSSINNLLYVHALLSASKTEAAIGEKTLAGYWLDKAKRTAGAVQRRFWCDKRGMFADTPGKDAFSEHAQCLAILSGLFAKDKCDSAFAHLIADGDLARTTVYFSHYLFETFIRCDRPDLVLRRLDLWRDYVADGLKTPLEAPGVRGRSDCHAWGSHPLYHLQTGIAGISPAADGFAAVDISPRPGSLKWIKASSPTPKGDVKIDLRFDGGKASGKVFVPAGLPATFRWNGTARTLVAGENTIE